MYEIRRILLNKKTVLTFILMLALNIIIFFRETDSEAFTSVKPSHDEYIREYSNKYENIKKNADMLLKGKEYSAPDSFSGRNIRKTLKDFAVVDAIKVTKTDETAANRLIGFRFTDYAMIIFTISIIMSMYDERKKAVWNYVYSAKNGRKRLARYKLFSLALGIMFSSIIMYAGNFLCAIIKYGDMGELGRAAQSNENFENLVMKISLGEAFIFILLIKIFALIFIGVMLWLLISNMSGQVMPFLIFGAIIFAQYFFYSSIDTRSMWKNLKYINIFGILDSQEMLGTYVNLNIFGHALNRVPFLCIGLLALLLLISGLTIYIGGRRPFTVKRSSRPIRLFQESTSIFLQELYKNIIARKIWIIFILYIAAAYAVTRPREIMYDYSTVIYNQYMENLSGGVSEEKINYLRNEISAWEGKLTELHKKAETSTDDSEIRTIYEKINNIEKAKEVTEAIYKDAAEMHELKEAGFNVGFVNSTGYDMLMGGGGKADSNIDAFIILVFMILTTSCFWSYDNQCEMTACIQSCVNGRGKITGIKYLIGALFAASAVAVLFALRCIKVNEEYGLGNFNLSIKSLSYFREGIPDISIGMFLIIFPLLRFINTFFAAAVVMYISSRAKNNVISIAVNIAAVLLPSCMYYIGIDFFKYISAAGAISVNVMWQRRNMFNQDFIIQEAVIFIIGMVFIQKIPKNFKK
ncbi:MAG: hypothetical protein K1W00_10400 [Lachnospiraceae bacterium]